MERETAQPLNPEEAKARLRAAATGSEVYTWLWKYPQGTALGAFIFGFVMGTSSAAREAVVNGVVALLKRSPAQGRAPVRGAKR
jgi:hypothetical protein